MRIKGRREQRRDPFAHRMVPTPGGTALSTLFARIVISEGIDTHDGQCIHPLRKPMGRVLVESNYI